MDIDPCAASRIEIVTKTSDLTAFELAGGTLDEPTSNVSTISDSPSHDRRIVNDVTIKQMRAEITHTIRCDICDVVCYGEETFKRHSEGHKHLKNTQKISPPPVANAKLHKESNKNAQDLLLNEASVNSLVCDIPDMASLHKQNIVTKHLEGKKTRGTLGEPTTKMSTTSHSPAHAQTIVKSVAVKQMLAEITHRVRCDICDVVCYGKETFKRHNEGKKHLENAQKLLVAMKEKIPPPVAYAKLNQESEKNGQDLLLNEELVSSLLDCDIPDLASFHKQNVVTKHLEGKKAGGTLGEPTTKVSTTSPSPAALAQPIKNDVAIKQIPTEIFHTIPCDSCDVICYGMEAFKRHKGNKHLKNSQKLPVAIKQTTSPLVANEISVNSLFVCDIPDMASCHNRNILTKHIEGKKAGETLNKPTTIVSTSSDPAANFKVSNQQTVKDVIVTKMEGVNANNIFCDICNVTCNSQKVFKRHKKGKKHVKNTQRLLISSAIKQETQLSVIKDTKQDLLQKEGTVNPLLVCDIPDLATYLDQNTVTKKPFIDGTQKAHAELDIRQPTWCEVCKVGYRSHKCFAKQNSGKQHLKNLKNSEKNMAQPSTNCIVSMDTTPIKSMKIPNLPSNIITSATTLPNDPAGKLKSTKGKAVNLKESNSVWCKLCKITYVSNDQLNKHKTGIKHKDNLRLSIKLFGHSPAPTANRSLQNPMITEGKVVFAERGKRKIHSSTASYNEDSNAKRQKVMEEEEVGSGVLVTCKACKVACNSIMAFNSHLVSFEHSAIVPKQVIGGGSEPQV